MSVLIYAINLGTYFVSDTHENYKSICSWLDTRVSRDDILEYKKKMYNKDRYFPMPISDGYKMVITHDNRNEFLSTIIGGDYTRGSIHDKYYNSDSVSASEYAAYCAPRDIIHPLLRTAGCIEPELSIDR
jgi:hypothetical protein